MNVQISPLKTAFSSRGIPSYQIELSHKGLHKHRIIKGGDKDFVTRKAHLQAAEWREQWNKKVALQNRVDATNNKKQLAADKTRDAQNLISELNNTLHHTIQVDDTIDWEILKDYSAFPITRPVQKKIERPTLFSVPPEPASSDEKYQPKLGFLDRIFTSRGEKKVAEAAELFQKDLVEWRKNKTDLTEKNEAINKAQSDRLEKANQDFQKQIAFWESEKIEFESKQKELNAAVDEQKALYNSGAPEAIVSYCDMVLSNSDYPELFPKEYELNYTPDNKILVVDYLLPAPEMMPTLSEVKYIAARDEYTEKHLSETQRTKLYDELIYQVTLRTIHELFEADTVDALSAIVFNGYVRAMNKASGHIVTSCILSVQANREEFVAINLMNVEPKSCFKQLKGIGSCKLHSITAVAPIIKIEKDDNRFVDSYDVAHTLDEGFNLAAMSWEDFEHLIREIFEKEFSSAGGEVRVTQASRDGGVDAVAFDPDPIRGGKIVIQAKRYTNTVGV